ncbi:MAG: CapA family protein [Hyphomicrobiaceae bacterium]|nr:MAG: CapA family protein [Hyphomicrobiaceae bacterium]
MRLPGGVWLRLSCRSLSPALALACALAFAGRLAAEPPQPRLANLPAPEEANDRAPAPQSRRQIAIVLTGDFGLSPHLEAARADGSAKHGQRLAWHEMLERIQSHLEGEIKFTNIETVISDRADLRPEPKAFNFKSHPEGVRHLVRKGFNVFSLANNHGLDFGLAGLHETLRNAEELKKDGLLGFAGLGKDRSEAASSAVFEVKGIAVAFAAIGILSQNHGHFRATTTRPGQLSYRAEEDFQLVADVLTSKTAAYRMLSVHFGAEMSVEPAPDQVRNAREVAVRGHGIDLVVGHHAHVVQPVEMVEGRLVFYGLGNFLHLGTQDMSQMGLCRDYGIVAKVHLAETEAGKLEARAVEIVPIRATHIRPEPLAAEAARDRIAVINYLADRLEARHGARHGLRFSTESDGRGLFCTPEARREAGRIGELCRDWLGPAVLTPDLARKISNSCAPTIASRRLYQARSHAGDKRSRQRQAQRGFFSTLFGDD